MGAQRFDDAGLVALMSAAQRGDAQAYTTLLETITPFVRTLVRRRRGFAGADVVEDVVQDVLLSVHSVRATYDSSRPFLPWLMAIVRHRLADHARRHFRRAAREVAADDPGVTFDELSANDPEGESGEREALAEAIRALPSGQRQAIELLKLKEMSLKDVAAQTGLSVGSLKVATHRAVASLRRALAKGR